MQKEKIEDENINPNCAFHGESKTKSVQKCPLIQLNARKYLIQLPPSLNVHTKLDLMGSILEFQTNLTYYKHGESKT